MGYFRKVWIQLTNTSAYDYFVYFYNFTYLKASKLLWESFLKSFILILFERKRQRKTSYHWLLPNANSRIRLITASRCPVGVAGTQGLESSLGASQGAQYKAERKQSSQDSNRVLCKVSAVSGVGFITVSNAHSDSGNLGREIGNSHHLEKKWLWSLEKILFLNVPFWYHV